MTTEPLTERERRCLEHLQQAQTLGVTLTEYAETFALDVKALYSRKQQLVKKGVLPAPTTPESEKSAFVAVRAAYSGRYRATIPANVGLWTLSCEQAHEPLIGGEH
jgi:hypothetical protein